MRGEGRADKQEEATDQHERKVRSCNCPFLCRGRRDVRRGHTIDSIMRNALTSLVAYLSEEEDSDTDHEAICELPRGGDFEGEV